MSYYSNMSDESLLIILESLAHVEKLTAEEAKDITTEYASKFREAVIRETIERFKRNNSE